MAVLTLLLCGCVWTETRPTLTLPPPEKPPPPPVVRAAPSQPPAKPEALATMSPPPPPPSPARPIIEVEEAEGLTAEETAVLFEQAREDLARECGAEAGILRFRFTAEGARAYFKVDPSSTWDSEARECALQALSISEIDEMIENARDPDERPLRMQSQIVISWP